MMLSSVEFIGVFVIVLALMLWSLWCDHKQQQQAKADAMVDDVFDRIEECMDVCDIERMDEDSTLLYWFDSRCVYDTWVHDGTQYITLRDELVGKVLGEPGKGGYFMYLIQVGRRNVWLARDYVSDGLLTAVEPKEAEAMGIEFPLD